MYETKNKQLKSKYEKAKNNLQRCRATSLNVDKILFKIYQSFTGDAETNMMSLMRQARFCTWVLTLDLQANGLLDPNTTAKLASNNMLIKNKTHLSEESDNVEHQTYNVISIITTQNDS